MTNIEKYSNIKKEMLCNEFYFQSLLQEAYNQAELSDSEMEYIQTQCITLLAKNTDRYNNGESSSVKIEVAETIMESNFYTIGIYLKSLPDIASALNTVKNDPISKLYQQGHRIINAKLNVAKHLYQLVCRTKLQSPNYTYNATIDEGIKSFFKQYNADYGAHETSTSIDYQLMNPVTDLAGVEYIIQYLKNLYMENSFCSKFDAAIIHEVMCGYDKGYKDLLVNIFGQVLQNALGCRILGKDILSLNILPVDIHQLKNIFINETNESIFLLLQQSAETVMKTLNIKSMSLNTYICASLPEIASRIQSAINTDTLQTIFLTRQSFKANQVIKYSMGNKMDDEAYRSIVNEVFACRYLEDKVQIIKTHIKTLADMEDIILDAELNEAEAFAIFKLLDDIEIAILVKRHPYHRDADAIEFSDAEIRLQQYLEKYLHGMPEDRLGQLQLTVSKLE